jgi:hypothetical protein
MSWGMEAWNDPLGARDMPALERALLRRGMSDRTAQREVCAFCRRTPLVGERVYLAESGTMLCELCLPRERALPVRCSTIHGQEFGHTLRISHPRAA